MDIFDAPYTQKCLYSVEGICLSSALPSTLAFRLIRFSQNPSSARSMPQNAARSIVVTLMVLWTEGGLNPKNNSDALLHRMMRLGENRYSSELRGLWSRWPPRGFEGLKGFAEGRPTDCESAIKPVLRRGEASHWRRASEQKFELCRRGVNPATEHPTRRSQSCERGV